jgi:two-component system response regulator YesN
MRSITEKESGNTVFLQESESQNKLAEDIIKILNDNIYERLTIDQIAKKINFSKAYIFRQFKNSIGISIMDYYISLKIKSAKELLTLGEFSIKEISEKLSFDTPNYFSKTFKKIVGVTPSQYKKRITD